MNRTYNSAIQYIIITVCTLHISCLENRSPLSSPNEKFKSTKTFKFASTIKIDKSLSSFYAVCYDEHSGWCSEEFKTNAEAVTALNNHRAKTGHTDNSVSNECLTSGNVAYADILVIKKVASPMSKQLVSISVDKAANPLFVKGMHFDSLSNIEKEKLNLSGGGVQLTAPNQVASLGSSTAGSSITVNISGQANVRIGMWFPLASTAAGQWIVAGPGSKTFQLNCNVLHPSPPGCPLWFGQPVNVSAEGINGTYPVWTSFN